MVYTDLVTRLVGQVVSYGFEALHQAQVADSGKLQEEDLLLLSSPLFVLAKFFFI